MQKSAECANFTKTKNISYTFIFLIHMTSSSFGLPSKGHRATCLLCPQVGWLGYLVAKHLNKLEALWSLISNQDQMVFYVSLCNTPGSNTRQWTLHYALHYDTENKAATQCQSGLSAPSSPSSYTALLSCSSTAWTMQIPPIN